jgi:hypothetical protein
MEPLRMSETVYISAATTMQTIRFLLTLDCVDCDYFHLEHKKQFTCTRSLWRKQISSNQCSVRIQRWTAIWFTDRYCGCWKMFTNGLWLWCRFFFFGYIGVKVEWCPYFAWDVMDCSGWPLFCWLVWDTVSRRGCLWDDVGFEWINFSTQYIIHCRV